MAFKTVMSESHSVVSDSLRPHGLYGPWNSPGQNTGVGCYALLEGIFPTQGSNPGLLHCRRILNQLSHKGSFRLIIENKKWENHNNDNNSDNNDCVFRDFSVLDAERSIATPFLLKILFSVILEDVRLREIKSFTHLRSSGVGDGQGGLEGCNSWGCKESDTTERLNIRTPGLRNRLAGSGISLPSECHAA